MKSPNAYLYQKFHTNLACLLHNIFKRCLPVWGTPAMQLQGWKELSLVMLASTALRGLPQKSTRFQIWHLNLKWMNISLVQNFFFWIWGLIFGYVFRLGKTRLHEFFQIYRPINTSSPPIWSAQGDIHGEIPQNRLLAITFDWSVLGTSG